MELSQIAELLGPFTLNCLLDSSQLQAVQRYLELLLRWNAKTNLTAVRDEINIVTRHFGEALFAAAVALSRDSVAQVIDLGSGAGFPGLPLKIHAPHTSLVLIESQNKKVAFLREVVRTLQLPGVKVYHGRAEQCPEHADLVTLRAVEHFGSILPVAAGLVRSSGQVQGNDAASLDSGSEEITPGPDDQRGEAGGRLALLVGAGQVAEAERILPSFSWLEPHALPGSLSRVVLVGQKRPARQ